MDKVSHKELEIVKKFFHLYLDQIPENKEDIFDFLNSLSTYDQKKHFDDDLLAETVSRIVDQYFQEKGKTIYAFGPERNSFVITDERIEERKTHMIKWIKEARDNERCDRKEYWHHGGGPCAIGQELPEFYRYVFDRYYASIGTTWEYR